MSEVGPATRAFPVSVKGVLLRDGRVLLLKNEREEWELPGGRLESGEDPVSCLVREVREELAIAVSVHDILDCWRYEVGGGEVVIVTYGCRPLDEANPAISAEHQALEERVRKLQSDHNTIVKEAREKLGYVMPGEVVLVQPQPKADVRSSAVAQTIPSPNPAAK